MNNTRGALIGFAMVLATLLVSVALSFLNVRQLRQITHSIEKSHEVLEGLESLLTATLTAQSNHRGYIITGERAHLDVYRNSVADVKEQSVRLQQLIADRPAHQSHWEELEQRLEWTLHLMDENVRQRAEEGFEPGRTFVLTGEGKIGADAVRSLIQKMEREEQRFLAARAGDGEMRYWTAVVTGLITAVMGVILAFGGYRLVQRELERRAKDAADLQAANERLEERVRERTAAITAANAALVGEIDERRRAEEQAFQFALDLQRSNRELEQFAAVASHDLQEPLRKIQAFGDRLRSRGAAALDDQSREYLERMLGAAQRMRSLIDDLLTYARVTTSARPFTAVDLEQIARDVVGDLDARLAQTGGTVHIGNLPTISADAVQMRQLLQNLIGNGLKFHRPDVPPRVEVSARVVPADNAEAADSGHSSNGEGARSSVCELIVSDNGIGFEPIYAERIFELFQRLHGRSAFEGTGMGLAICRKIVERHGGTIAATSAPGQGARFVVHLPAATRAEVPHHDVTT
jgi:signal transduction histidine kinase